MILASPATAVLREYPVPVGTFLRKGDRIGQITGGGDPTLVAKLDIASAQLDSVKAALADADAKHKQNIELKNKNLVSNSDVLSTAMQLKSAQLRVEAAQEKVDQAQALLNQSRPQLLMPFDGVVWEYQVEIGQHMQIGQAFVAVKRQTAPTPTTDLPGEKLPQGKRLNTKPSGLQWVDLQDGQGPAAEDGDTIEVHYTGWLAADGKQFDSSRDKASFQVELGKGLMIKGWEEGLIGMRAGGRRKLVIPPELAYGDAGAAGTIPAKSTLIFDIEALSLVSKRTPVKP
jgi:FKBP-type peptidyl-prolyl cis-trans isomerase